MLTDAQCRAAKPREGIYRLNDYKGLYLVGPEQLPYPATNAD